MNHSDFGKLHTSFAIMRDSVTILGYLIDKKRKNIPIDEDDRKIVREHRMLLENFMHEKLNGK